MDSFIFLLDSFYISLINIFWENPIAQTIGLLGILCSIFTFVSNSNISFLYRLAFTSFIWSLHFFLLGALSAFFINFIDIFKNLLAIKFPNNKKILFGIVVFYLLIGIFMYLKDENFITLIPIIASLFSVMIIFLLKDIAMRIGFLVLLFGWMIYNYFNHSIGGLTTDIILFFVGLIGIIRILILNKK
jgi:hypothetical protein